MQQRGVLTTKGFDLYELNKFRVTRILLLSTPYDGFVLEEDGVLAEQLYHQFSDLSLPYIPKIQRISTLAEAIEELNRRNYHLIITMFRHNDIDAFAVERNLRQLHPHIPIVLLSYDRLTNDMISQIRSSSYIDRAFYWSGDSKILLAIIKYVEDVRNIEEDSRQGVQTILVVDDSPVYYSQILPAIYTEILTQTRYLVSHAMNLSHGLLRVRLRPKIMLAETYEEALNIIERYQHTLLGVISDVRFPMQGDMTANAGFLLADKVRELVPEFPFLLQSEENDNAFTARIAGIKYLDKNSPNLLHEIRSHILENYGFGSFIFRYPDGRVIAEAADITELERQIRIIPDESLYYHAINNHFSTWFRARTEFEVAEKLRVFDATDSPDISTIRFIVLEILKEYFQTYQTGVILDFESLSKKDMDQAFIKLGSGSLGGKARGVAFINSRIAESGLSKKYSDMVVKIPRSFVICSGVFEQFIEENHLYEFVANEHDENKIATRFLASQLPENILDNLRTLAQNLCCPLVVRSSSILEDSRVLPFAGIYKTYIAPNYSGDFAVRFKQLSDAVKLVFASVFYEAPIRYAKNAGIRIEEEKMAVLIQELVGDTHDDLFYPTISGVGQSYNYYPYYPMKPEEGTVSLALGLGKIIVDGEQSYRFSPRHPKIPPPYSSPSEQFHHSQTYFYAINLKRAANILIGLDENANYEKHALSRAELDGTLLYTGSTFSSEDNCVYDSSARRGPKLITFAPILKYNRLPLVSIIKDILELGKQSFASDVEIEFAVDISADRKRPAQFYFLQIRPVVAGREAGQVQIDNMLDGWCFSNHTVGNGVYRDIFDVIFVDPQSFDIKNSTSIAAEIGELNNMLFSEGRKCILIGFGRLGTSDRWLGIPLAWQQMSQAQVVVEVDTADLHPEPSLGSHFFHNLTSMNIGYFHIRHNKPDAGAVDWLWLAKQPVYKTTAHVKLIRCTQPITVKIDGRQFIGSITYDS